MRRPTRRAGGVTAGRALPVRVLYLHGFDRVGGAEQAVLRLVEVIRQWDVEPLLVWPRRDGAVLRLQARGIRVALLKVFRWRGALSAGLLPLFLARLRRVVDESEFDCVHVNNYRSAPFGQLVSRWARVPWVCHVRELITGERARRYRLRSSDASIAVSRAVADALIEAGAAPGTIAVIHSGVPAVAALSPEEIFALRRSLRIAPHEPVIGIVAHVLPHKGYDDLVRSLALIRTTLPDIRCLIVGETPRRGYRRDLLDLAGRLGVGDRLTWVGFREDVSRLLQAMDLFVLPSHTEGLPLTILEAMAAARPIVATAVGGIPEVVRDGETGILVPPGDPERLAEAALRILGAPERARWMGERGRAQVERDFTLAAEAERTSMVYRRVLDARTAALAAPGSPRPAG
jgi:glycosyltransferase involved in cell wall biosynthesis